MTDQVKNTKKAKCPECGSKAKTPIIGASNFAFTNPVGTDRFTNSHGYRHEWNMDRKGGIKAQRKNAEEKSHVGPTPYNPIDDVTSGKHFGEVK
jgi:rRNA maturation protein Nop10